MFSKVCVILRLATAVVSMVNRVSRRANEFLMALTVKLGENNAPTLTSTV